MVADASLEAEQHGSPVVLEGRADCSVPSRTSSSPSIGWTGSGGTGIGLAITRRAVLLHGGGITADNAEGGGLQVTLRLPLRPEASLA